ncbi:hypothetical protein FNV43_RR01210 [Rhamnella rubrinervis]|uniref:Uncharacterized protein n=1 Tax=Rhamnella rubrinervis TaxID=2594499 RepID=A0A8K0HP74_9ROSA|nr:hypothetical protein FNV43_RR01210 [Rhamnella rubrinervis]
MPILRIRRTRSPVVTYVKGCRIDLDRGYYRRIPGINDDGPYAEFYKDAVLSTASIKLSQLPWDDLAEHSEAPTSYTMPSTSPLSRRSSFCRLRRGYLVTGLH